MAVTAIVDLLQDKELSAFNNLSWRIPLFDLAPPAKPQASLNKHRHASHQDALVCPRRTRVLSDTRTTTISESTLRRLSQDIIDMLTDHMIESSAGSGTPTMRSVNEEVTSTGFVSVPQGASTLRSKPCS